MAGSVVATFKPARSFGWAWLLALTLVIALAAVPLVRPDLAAEDEQAAVWIGIAIMVPLLAYMLVTLASLPAMRYDLTTEELVLSCGPLVRYRIPYTTIDDVRRTTLTPTLWSSMRMPGLALGGVPYAGVGTVRMCATRMSRDILLVTAGNRRYGLTPADEAAFVAQLTLMLPRSHERHLISPRISTESPQPDGTFGATRALRGACPSEQRADDEGGSAG